MPKYSVGITYTHWIDVEAENTHDAIEKAVQVEPTLDQMELNEFDDPVVYEHEEDGFRNV